MPITMQLQQDDWRKALFTDRKGLRDQHDRGRLQGGFLDGQFLQDGHWKHVHNKKGGPSTRADGIGECELMIDGERWVEVDGKWWVEVDGKWVPESAAGEGRGR
jgi:hypothetical protein